MRLAPWDPEEYDRQIKAERARARQQQRQAGQAPLTTADARRIAGRRDRQSLCPQVSRRRRSTPRQQPDGLWLVEMVHQRISYRGRFDTRAEAKAFLSRVRGEE